MALNPNPKSQPNLWLRFIWHSAFVMHLFCTLAFIIREIYFALWYSPVFKIQRYSKLSCPSFPHLPKDRGQAGACHIRASTFLYFSILAKFMSFTFFIWNFFVTLVFFSGSKENTLGWGAARTLKNVTQKKQKKKEIQV